METWRGYCPSALSKGSNRGGGAFSYQYHWKFHGLSRSTWNKFIAAIRAPTKFRMIFYNFCYYFWGQYCWWTETKYKFPLLSTVLMLLLLRRPWICMLCQQTWPKRLFANVNMTSYCDVTNSVYQVTRPPYATALPEFRRGHPIKQSSRASPDLCNATGTHSKPGLNRND